MIQENKKGRRYLIKIYMTKKIIKREKKNKKANINNHKRWLIKIGWQ